MEAMTMGRQKVLTGTIKRMLRKEGYGFIEHPASGEDYFFHRRAMSDDAEWEELIEGDPVEFTEQVSSKGLRAATVRVLR